MFLNWLMEKIGWMRISKYEYLEYRYSSIGALWRQSNIDLKDLHEMYNERFQECRELRDELARTEKKLATQNQMFRPWSDANVWEIDAYPMQDDGSVHPDWEASRGKPQSVKLRRKKK